MAQNIVSITISDVQRGALFAAVDQLEQQLADVTTALDQDLRRDLFKMGVKSETFCRQAQAALDKNRQVVPPSLGLDEALLDLRTLDVVRPLLQRLEQMTELLRDTEMALGSDLMDTAVEGYGLLKVTGQNQGLDGLLRTWAGVSRAARVTPCRSRSPRRARPRCRRPSPRRPPSRPDSDSATPGGWGNPPPPGVFVSGVEGPPERRIEPQTWSTP